MFSKRNSYIKSAEKRRPFETDAVDRSCDFPAFAFLEDRPATLIILLVRKPRAKQMQPSDLPRRHIWDSGRILAKQVSNYQIGRFWPVFAFNSGLTSGNKTLLIIMMVPVLCWNLAFLFFKLISLTLSLKTKMLNW